jgi:hypothetical protein
MRLADGLRGTVAFYRTYYDHYVDRAHRAPERV